MYKKTILRKSIMSLNIFRRLMRTMLNASQSQPMLAQNRLFDQPLGGNARSAPGSPVCDSRPAIASSTFFLAALLCPA